MTVASQRTIVPSAWAALAIGALGAAAHAQVPGAMTWQVSLDDGASWMGGDIGVGPAQTSVRVRMLASWDESIGGTSPPVWFWDTRFDAVVAQAGSGDTISSIRGRTSAGGLQSLDSVLNSQRYDNSLKIDSRLDTQAPGVGPSWVVTSQGSVISGQFVFDNPIEMFSYTLSLDGTLGTRTISGIWAPNFNAGGIPYIRLSTGESVQATFHDARIIVPTPGAPGPCAMALLACGAIRRRRRGG